MEKSNITGILYDPLTLNHRCGRDHPERPKRVSSIIQHLRSKHFLHHPRIDFVEKLKEAPLDLIQLVHPKKYTNYVNNLWTEDCQRSHIMVLDTYFNKHTNTASNLAVGGVIQGLDNVVSGKWKNAFAVVRPPGHHSGARNVINGFCIYNNVAIGVQYLRTKYNIKKIAVFDWDVHHGDGTQHIFREDPDLLFISLHRHDRGTFYPGESGSFLNVGLGSAEGKQLNMPWNLVDKLFRPHQFTPGDNQYIYVFERGFFPILKEFKPEFIIISAGFDSARGDPLGGMSVGPEGYHYMTTKLMTLAPLIVVLEGGYNLKSISWAAESVVCALMGEEGPRETKIPVEKMKNSCWLPQYHHFTIDLTLNYFQKYWPVLGDEKLVTYEKMIKANTKRVLGNVEKQSESSSSEDQEEEEQQKQEKHPQDAKKQQKKAKKKEKKTKQQEKQPNKTASQIKEDNPYFYFVGGHVHSFTASPASNSLHKKVKDKKQIEFYQSDFPQKKFAPHFFGNVSDTIIIDNLLFDLKNPNVADIKLAGPKVYDSAIKTAAQAYKYSQSLSSTLGFRVLGYATQQKRVVKGIELLTKDEEVVRDILRKVIYPQHRKQMCEFLAGLSSTLKDSTRHYRASSILVVNTPETLRVRWIDFTYWEQKQAPDEELIRGINNLKCFIAQL